MENKRNWLDQLLEDMDMTAADLSKATGIDSAVISNIRNGRRGTGIDVAVKVGGALNLPPEMILRLAGEFPSQPDSDPWVEEQLYKLKQVPPELRSKAAKAIELFVEEEAKPKHVKRMQKTKPTS